MEIERKWLWIHNENFPKILKNKIPVLIKDYYFNSNCRLRNIDDKWILAIKSNGTLIREENEFTINPKEVKLKDEIYLIKHRYFLEYKHQKFEINVFLNTPLPIILIELELKDKSQKIFLPKWMQNNVIDVTENENLYGYHLYVNVKNNLKN